MKSILLTLLVTTALSTANAQPPALTDLLNAYYDVKDALIASDSKTASVKASAFEQLIANMNEKAFTEQEQKILAQTIPVLKKEAGDIVSAKNIEEQRKHFQVLSDKLFTLVEGVNKVDAPIYQQYCPMKKAYWLSKEQSIKNPYYGKQMLNCGKVTKTLN